MLPFPIISNTNILPKKDIVKFDTTNGSMYLLYSTGDLYGLGRNTTYQMGNNTNTTVTSWTLISTVNGMYVCGNCRYGQLGNGVTDINTYVTTPQKFTASNPDSLENYSGFTVINYQGSVQYCGHNGRSGNGLSTGYASTLTPAPNILSTDFYVNVSATYYIQNNSLYATGSPGTYSLLPGYSSSQLSFVKLELP